MDDEHNPRAELGDNAPPLADQLEVDFAELTTAMAEIEMRAFQLPQAPVDDEECAKLITFVADAKRVIKKAEAGHTEQKAPWLERGRIVDTFFKSIWNPLGARVETVEARVNAYNRAKAAREKAQREEAARLERVAAQAARDEVQRQEKLAAEAAKREQEAAAALRAASDESEREARATEMREAAQQGAAAREASKDASKEAVQADRVAEANQRAASGSVAKLGKVTTSGASAAVTTFWNHRITDGPALVASLGPLGPHLTNDAIVQAIGVVKRELGKKGKLSEFTLPGVQFFEDTKTNVRQAREP